MAKSRKNIGAFQQAMLSNTKMISAKKDINKSRANQKKTSIKEKDDFLNIDPELNMKIEKMSKKYGIHPKTLIEKGLNLFVSLEEYWFKD